MENIKLKKYFRKNDPVIEKRINLFKIIEGMTIIDYGCGSGRYIYAFSKAVGKEGNVFAVDINENVKNEVEKIKTKNEFDNVEFYLANEYKCTLNHKIADMVFALDVFHLIKNKEYFLMELNRICKDDGILIIDHEHQLKNEVKKIIKESNIWEIMEEIGKYFKCKKK